MSATHLVWIRTLDRIVRPVLAAAAEGRLSRVLPHIERCGRNDIAAYEALARSLTGLSPLLAADGLEDEAGDVQAELRELAVRALQSSFDPDGGAMRFDIHRQQLVEAAFLSHAFLRAPAQLWDPLDEPTRCRILDNLRLTRIVTPGANNWTLFAAMVETFLGSLGEDVVDARVSLAVRLHESWYLGDGVYGDGPDFHADYYNSLVIHPMMLDVHGPNPPEHLVRRAQRYAIILERMISPDGTYPPIGRSLAYRVGVFHLLAQMAMQRRLPDELKPAQVREALTAAIRRCFDAPRTFTDEGFLTVGLSGCQPSIGENYINSGSVYLCTAAFLPLGLSPSDPFWADPPSAFTQQRVFAGEDIAADHAW